MRDYILKRLLQIIPTILMIALVVFAMMHTIPGDPIIALLGVPIVRKTLCSCVKPMVWINH
jgi:ABC-type dipeptide/oligopeptide/nickel transport system permease component